MMYRMLLALPAAALASTAASGRVWKSARPATLHSTIDNSPSQATLTMENSSAQNDVGTKSGQETLLRRERLYRVPSRFTLEDDEAIREALRFRPPPVGEASLNSGLSVEVSAW